MLPLPPAMVAPPLAGIAPPPVGPRLPDPRAIADLKAGIAKLLDAAEKDPLVAREVNPIVKRLIEARAKLLTPPPPPREEVQDAEAGPLDQSPMGDMGGGTLLAALPRLMGLAGR